MAIAAMAPSLLRWGIRGAAVGLICDFERLLKGETKSGALRNTLINLVHGLAIGIIAATFGSAVAWGAAIVSILVLPKCYNYENHPKQAGDQTKSIAIRVMATLLGSVIGALK